MNAIRALLDGRKAYLFLIAYCVLVLSGNVQEGGLTMPDNAEIQKLVLAGAGMALRAAIAKLITAFATTKN